MLSHKDPENVSFCRYKPIIKEGTLLNYRVTRSSSTYERIRANEIMTHKVARRRSIKARFRASLMHNCRFAQSLEPYI